MGMVMLLTAAFGASPTVDYHAEVDPRTRRAAVEMSVSQEDGPIRRLEFRLKEEQFEDFEGEGLVRTSTSVVWRLPAEGGVVRWKARLVHARDDGSYDARITPSWALFRGTDLVPLLNYQVNDGAQFEGRLRFDVPTDWSVISREGQSGAKDAVELQSSIPVPVPRGWFLLGEVESVQVKVGACSVRVASPHEQREHLYARAAFLQMTLPHFQELVGQELSDLLVVTADDPMWRGGLSGPGSIFLHDDRPLVTRDWTSPILHEIFHVATAARSRVDSDWLVEGLAEWSALKVLQAAGGLSEDAWAASLKMHAQAGKDSGPLLDGPSTGDKTRKAVALLDRFNSFLQRESDGERSLEDVLRVLVREQPAFTTNDFLHLVKKATGVDARSFFADEGVLPDDAGPPASDEAEPGGDESESLQERGHSG